MSAPFMLIFQILAHASFLMSFLWFSPADWAGALVVYILTGCLGLTVTYHRLLSHRSWKAPSWARALGLLAGVWSLSGSPLTWVAIHRQHHRFTDTVKDPHSPLFMTWWRVQWLTMLEPADLKYAADLKQDRVVMILHHWYEILHGLILVTLISVFSLKTAMICYLTPAAILWNANALVNTLCHRLGYRSYETADASRNFWPLGLLAFGEGFHNNHHGAPASPRFGHRWFEFDLGYSIIRFLQRPLIKP